MRKNLIIASLLAIIGILIGFLYRTKKSLNIISEREDELIENLLCNEDDNKIDPELISEEMDNFDQKIEDMMIELCDLSMSAKNILSQVKS